LRRSSWHKGCDDWNWNCCCNRRSPRNISHHDPSDGRSSAANDHGNLGGQLRTGCSSLFDRSGTACTIKVGVERRPLFCKQAF
jgi:hypothetical protein